MEKLRNTSAVARWILPHLREKFGYDKAFAKRDMLYWMDERDGWYAPRKVIILEYAPEIWRLTGRSVIGYQLPAKFWPMSQPEQRDFELSFCSADLGSDFVADMIELVNSSYRGLQDPPKFRGLSNAEPSYPSYAWTAFGEALYSKQPRSLR